MGIINSTPTWIYSSKTKEIREKTLTDGSRRDHAKSCGSSALPDKKGQTRLHGKEQTFCDI